MTPTVTCCFYPFLETFVYMKLSIFRFIPTKGKVLFMIIGFLKKNMAIELEHDMGRGSMMFLSGLNKF